MKDEALDKALELALEALEKIVDAIYVNSQQEAKAICKANDAITAIKQARAAPVREDWWPGLHEYHSLPPAAQPAPVQKPVAWMDADGDVYKSEPHPNWCPPHVPLCIIPPAAQRQWVGLTDKERDTLIREFNGLAKPLKPN